MKLHSPRQIVSGIERRRKALFRQVKNLVLGPPELFLKECQGVIHIGAHYGVEREEYDRHSLRVVWIEALPSQFEVLQNNLRGHSRHTGICALVTDKDGEEYEFHVSSNAGVSSSIFDFKDHKKMWPSVTFTESVKLRSKRLATVLREAGRTPSEFDAMVMDVQGAEALVIQGAGEFLEPIRFIKAEAADFELYAGACTLETLTAVLREKGFAPIRKDCFQSTRGVGSCYDVVFKRLPPGNA